MWIGGRTIRPGLPPDAGRAAATVKGFTAAPPPLLKVNERLSVFGGTGSM